MKNISQYVVGWKCTAFGAPLESRLREQVGDINENP
jgi:hypothetical protein